MTTAPQNFETPPVRRRLFDTVLGTERSLLHNSHACSAYRQPGAPRTGQATIMRQQWPAL